MNSEYLVQCMREHINGMIAREEKLASKKSIPGGWDIIRSDDGFIRLVKVGDHGGASWTIGFSLNSELQAEAAAAMFLTELFFNAPRFTQDNAGIAATEIKA